MLPLAAALTLSLSSLSLPDLPPLPNLPQGFEARVQHCPDADPHFVHYIAPPGGAGPVWPISAGNAGAAFVAPRLDAGQLANAKTLSAPPRLGCARLIPAGR
jgi:hypothetical protein